jgi:LPS-assembly lipoprotein
MRRTWLRAAGAIAATQFASACGFQLRQAAQFQFSTLYAGFPPGSLTHVEFRRQMRVNQGVALVDRPEAAEVRLEVLQEFREKETVSFSSTGRPREYQLRLHFAFRLAERDGEELIPPTQLLLRREITTTDDQLVAKEQEEAYLFRRMHADLAEQLVMRLAAVRR